MPVTSPRKFASITLCIGLLIGGAAIYSIEKREAQGAKATLATKTLDLASVRAANLKGCSSASNNCGYGTEKDGWIPFTNASQHYRMSVPATLWDASVSESAPTVVYQPGDALAYIAPAYRYLDAGALLDTAIPLSDKHLKVENQGSDIVTSPEYKSDLIQSIDVSNGSELVAAGTAYFGDCGFTYFTFTDSGQDGTYDITLQGTGLSNSACSYVSGDPAVAKGEGTYPAVIKYSTDAKKALFVASYPGCRWPVSGKNGEDGGCGDVRIFKSIFFTSN